MNKMFLSMAVLLKMKNEKKQKQIKAKKKTKQKKPEPQIPDKSRQWNEQKCGTEASGDINSYL